MSDSYVDLKAAQTAVRMFTDKDPYHYTIDNRPLGDLNTNQTEIVDATEAARRAHLMDELANSAFLGSMVGSDTYITGLVGSVTSGSATISPGTLVIPQNLSDSDTTQVRKLAGTLTTSTFSASAPSTFGHEISYLIECSFQEVQDQAIPYNDSANDYLPSSVLHGTLSLRIRPGVEGTTGATTPPSVASGWFGLYVVKSSRGVDSSVTTTGAEYGSMPVRIKKLTDVAGGGDATIVRSTSDPTTTYSMNISAGTHVVTPQIYKVTASGTYIILVNASSAGWVDSSSAFSREYWIFNSMTTGSVTLRISGIAGYTIMAFDDSYDTVTVNIGAGTITYTLGHGRMLKLKMTTALTGSSPVFAVTAHNLNWNSGV